mmetsp:Transcript_34937/g.80796  ORF Transcript_34937/g.80796 Transcript_34937/m.80796 type:complete len:218 (-) Transcript_34937:630-1283(-)
MGERQHLPGAAVSTKNVEESDDMSSTNKKIENVPMFSLSEIKLGKSLGKGSFCIVYEITGFNLVNEKKHDERTIIDQDKHHLWPKRPTTDTTLDNKEAVVYALKKLRQDLTDENRLNGISDLEKEVYFLSTICHPNIISMRGMINRETLNDSYSLIMDRLHDTLEDRLKKWSFKKKTLVGFGGRFKKKTAEIDRLWFDRMVVACDITSALSFLHTQK